MLLIYIAIGYFALDFILVYLKFKRKTKKPRRAKNPAEFKKTIAAEQKQYEKIHNQLDVALLELSQLDCRRDRLLEMYSLLETDYNRPEISQTKQIALKKQMLQLDDKIETLDIKRAKLYCKIKILDAA